MSPSTLIQRHLGTRHPSRRCIVWRHALGAIPHFLTSSCHFSCTLSVMGSTTLSSQGLLQWHPYIAKIGRRTSSTPAQHTCLQCVEPVKDLGETCCHLHRSLQVYNSLQGVVSSPSDSIDQGEPIKVQLYNVMHVSFHSNP